MKEKFSLKTASGCVRWMAVLLCVILVCSFFGCMVESSWGSVKVTNVKFDARGAVQDAELYVPVGTSDRDSLPCVILSHGGGCTNGVMKGTAQELARRGFVVLNVSSYGAGLSEQPMYDEDGNGIEGMAVNSQGLWDAVNYVRTLKYVDQTKIVVGGHSQGAYRSSYVAINDCGYFSKNDLMLNYINEEFGVEPTEEEISQDARTVAEKYLDEGQMLCFDMKEKEVDQWVDTRIKAIIPIGSATVAVSTAMRPQTVTVAGHEVTRFVQTNVGLICGKWDHNFPFVLGKSSIFEGESFPETYFQTGSETIFDTWLQLTDSGTAVNLGNLYETSLASNEALRAAVENRSTRVAIGIERTTHSKEFLSNDTTAAVVKYVEQLLEYNNGDINGINNAIAYDNIVWQWREYLNTVAMLAMIGFAAVLLIYISKKEYFKAIAPGINEAYLKPQPKKYFNAVFWALAVVLTGISCYWANVGKHTVMKRSQFFPLDDTAGRAFNYLLFAGLFLLILTAVFAVLRKKQTGDYGLKKLGIDIGVKNVFKTLLACVIVIAICYGTLAFIEYWFFQDYRWWMCVFTEMQPFHWGQFIRYSVLFIPFYFVISAATNYTTDAGSLSRKSDIVVTVLVGSLGIYINHFINMIGLYANEELTLLSEATIVGGLLMFVPITLYISRKTYKATGSIWSGTFINAFLNAWMFVSAISTTNTYMGTTFLEKFLGF